ncbi:MAG: hypothetical protein AAFV98_11000 [Chloroflexota bacterium]
MKSAIILFLFSVFILTSCQQAPDMDALPTLADPESLATAIVLTENAPPAGYETVSFPRLDDNTQALAGWRAEMFFQLEGAFARTTRETSASTNATITYDQVGSARRVIATRDLNLAEEAEPLSLEAVRLGEDTFLVREGRCASNVPDGDLLADLSAGDLLGGVTSATSASQRETINGEEVWLYRFLAEDLVLPNITLGEDARLLSAQGDLWVAPEHDVVVRFNLTLVVENATIFDQDLPISGTISMQYDLYDIGTVPNLSIPNGC